MNTQYDKDINDYLQDCLDDGEPTNKLKFFLSGFLKAKAAIEDNGDIYKLAGDTAFLKEKVEGFLADQKK